MQSRLRLLGFSLLSCVYVATAYLPDSQQENIHHITYKLAKNAHADWLIVGGGPAGIVTIGVLMDIGVDPARITWIDPEFEVGRLGKYYTNVPSNNRAKELIAFINACATFQDCKSPSMDALKTMDPQQFCIISSIVEPLQCISDYLRTKVSSVQDTLSGLYFDQGLWYAYTPKHGSFSANHVVLATGCNPRTLPYNNQNIIPLDYALDVTTLKTLVVPEDTVGVVGGAHSAILLLRYFSEMNVKQVYNFYRHPITYAIDMGCWALDQQGIKGSTAEWAKEVLEKNPPAHISRVQFDKEAELASLLAPCSKVIYAIGYDRNTLPVINGTTPITNYNEATGVIAPRLFGIGIAFPEYKVDNGQGRHLVGLNCFMDYAQRLIPQWVNDADLGDQIKRRSRAETQRKVLEKWTDLFTICSL